MKTALKRTAPKLLLPLAVSLGMLAPPSMAQAEVTGTSATEIDSMGKGNGRGMNTSQSHSAPELSSSLLVGGLVLLGGGLLVMLGSRRRSSPAAPPT